MIVRASLCALDWNSNVCRPHKLDELGKPLYREKVCILYKFPLLILISNQVDRSGKNRVVVPVLVAKDTSWQDRIVEFCEESLESGDIPSPQVDSITIQLVYIFAQFFSFQLRSCLLRGLQTFLR